MLHLRAILPPAAWQEPDGAALAEFAALKGGRRWIGFSGRVSREKGLELIVDVPANGLTRSTGQLNVSGGRLDDGSVQAVLVDPRTGKQYGAADSRLG